MKSFAFALALVAIVACVKTETAPPTETETMTTAAATSAPASEKTYTMNGVIVSRAPAKNTVNIDNEDVPGVMAPMKMDYELRGATVDSLPADGSRVTMTLHEQDGKFWVSDVKPQQ